MKKVYGMTIGGLKQKIFNLVLIALLLMVVAFTAVTFFQSGKLNKAVSQAREKQFTSIKDISEDTIYRVVDSSLTKTNALQAYIADDMFADVKKDVLKLRVVAESLLKEKDTLPPHTFSLPQKENEGKVSVQVLFEEGVDYSSSRYLNAAAHMSDVLVAMYENSGKIGNCYIGLADGINICVDEHAANKFDEEGNIIPFPVRERPWYKEAAEKKDIVFSGVSIDTYTGILCVTCSAPVYVDGQLQAVVGADIFLEDMNEYVMSSSSEGSFIAVVDDEGKVIFAPENNGIFTVEVEKESDDLRQSENKALAHFTESALKEKTGLKEIKINGKDYYMAASPIQTVNWAVVSVVEKDITQIPTDNMLKRYDSINDEVSASYRQDSKNTLIVIFVAVMLVFAVGLVTAVRLAEKILHPIETMTKSIIHSAETGSYFEMKDDYKTDDEIEMLAEAFADLSSKTEQYIKDITRITKEKERIGTELELARKIQKNMLPNIFPPFPDHPEVDIYATMTPAKEVGGDFYDFFLIDEDHLGIVMADVSGKGVPAALFMMMSKILINNFAMHSLSPAKVLEKTNEVICRNNEQEMFVTVWLGVLEISTGKIKAANAGHEYPIIRNDGGDFKLYKDRHGFVVGGFDSTRYKEYEMELKKGDTLFLYTDGVPEATDMENEMYGTDLLISVLNKNKECSSKQLLENVKLSIDDFVAESDQFDDLTMLAIKLV
ncbi:MAG: SpoIIE family protein phosphatase [Firmicutes bacterium]|nr:SpoIIE family protein phosphatase [Bacillota bacterium]